MTPRLALAIVFSAFAFALAPSDARAQARTGPARDAQGPLSIAGSWDYANFGIADVYEEPSVLLMDASRLIQRNFRDFVPRSQQILGRMTSPLAPPPAKLEVDLPRAPQGERISFGSSAGGVQVYVFAVCPNLVGDSYVEQTEQSCQLSVLPDPVTGAIREGSFLIYSAGAGEPFPAAAGRDGVYFTADDPVARLEPGYTVARLSATGTVSFDRSERPRMDVLEAPAVASPDFSDKGILESYQALIDLLKQRYSFTALARLDWEALRAAYLPRVTAADRANDMPAYQLALFDLAQQIRDSHVSTRATAPAVQAAPYLRMNQMTEASVGAAVAHLTDGRFIVTWLDPQGPAAAAGWRFGTEILAIDGERPTDRLATRPYAIPQGTVEGVRTAQLPALLRFPLGATPTVEYRQPGEGAVRKAALAATPQARTGPPTPPADVQGISFKALDNGVGYIQWTAFLEPVYKLAVWEKFLRRFHAAPGIVIDLRHNTGGSGLLFSTMASYLFSAANPATDHWIDFEIYDAQAGRLVRQLATESRLSAPKPSLAYDGAVVVIVDEVTDSAGEYFPQFLQRQGRAKVVSEYATRGGGGPIDIVKLPGTITFQYTTGRTLFAGSNEPNLQAKGVSLDVRVPVTEEGEKAKLAGGDPVLDAALSTLQTQMVERLRSRLGAQPWSFRSALDGRGLRLVQDPGKYGITFGSDGSVRIKADCNNVAGSYTPGANNALSISIGPSTRAACAPGSLADAWTSYLGAVRSVRPGDEPGTLLLVTDPGSGVLAITLAPAAVR